ncbi:MAG: dTDP-4-dehydrorhamnose 3,5-epimerase [Pseudomonadota bacterium]
MEVVATAIPEVKLLKPKYHGDERGYFAEVFNERNFAEADLPHTFVQDNQSRSAVRGTMRGLHFQTPPFAQTKILRVLKGAVLDVAVDLRRGSPTFGHHVMVELTAANRLQIVVPKGFAHGFLTLEAETEVLYKVDAYFAPDHDRGVRFDDPDLAIAWPEDPGIVVLSDKDQRQPWFRDLPACFDCETQ